MLLHHCVHLLSSGLVSGLGLEWNLCKEEKVCHVVSWKGDMQWLS